MVNVTGLYAVTFPIGKTSAVELVTSNERCNGPFTKLVLLPPLTVALPKMVSKLVVVVFTNPLVNVTFPFKIIGASMVMPAALLKLVLNVSIVADDIIVCAELPFSSKLAVVPVVLDMVAPLPICMFPFTNNVAEPVPADPTFPVMPKFPPVMVKSPLQVMDLGALLG